MKEQQVAVTTRLAIEVERLKASAPDNPDGLVSGILDNVKRSFTAARSKAGLNDVRFHDLTQTNTTYRYVNANVETAKRAAAALDAFNAETQETTAPELMH
jgi:hypothetical protein